MSTLVFVLLASWGQLRVEPEAINETLRGKRIVVEGVYNGAIGTGATRQLRLLHSKAKFLPERHHHFDLKGADNVEIVGFVRFDGRDTLVDIQSLSILPTDVDRYQRRTLEIDARDHHGWYALSDWSLARSKKYPNEDLANLSQQAYRRAVAIERRNANGKADSLRELIQKVKSEKRIKDFDTADIEHEILRIESSTLDRQSPDALREFARRLRDRLPFRERTEMTPLAPAAREEYEKDPLAYFAARGADGRSQLARYWQVALLDQAHERLYVSKQNTPIELADQAASEMPDYPEYEEKWILRALERTRASLETLSRREIEAASKRIHAKLGDEELIHEILWDWLETQTKKLHEAERAREHEALANGAATPQRDARKRYELAQTYIEWFKADKEAPLKAMELLRETLAIDPSFGPATALLERLGYRQRPGGGWVGPEEGARSDAIADGGAVRVGMSSEKVLATLGAPDSQARVATAGTVGHVWTYAGIEEKTYIVFVQSGDGAVLVSAVHRSK